MLNLKSQFVNMQLVARKVFLSLEKYKSNMCISIFKSWLCTFLHEIYLNIVFLKCVNVHLKSHSLCMYRMSIYYRVYTLCSSIKSSGVDLKSQFSKPGASRAALHTALWLAPQRSCGVYLKSHFSKPKASMTALHTVLCLAP